MASSINTKESSLKRTYDESKESDYHSTKSVSLISLGSETTNDSNLSSCYDELLASEKTIFDFIPDALQTLIDLITGTIPPSQHKNELTKTESEFQLLTDYLTNLNNFISKYNIINPLETPENKIPQINYAIQSGIQLQESHGIKPILLKLFSIAPESETLIKKFIPNFKMPSEKNITELKLTKDQITLLKNEVIKDAVQVKLARILTKIDYIETLVPRLQMMLKVQERLKQSTGTSVTHPNKMEQIFYVASALNEKIKELVDNNVVKEKEESNYESELQWLDKLRAEANEVINKLSTPPNGHSVASQANLESQNYEEFSSQSSVLSVPDESGTVIEEGAKTDHDIMQQIKSLTEKINVEVEQDALPIDTKDIMFETQPEVFDIDIKEAVKQIIADIEHDVNQLMNMDMSKIQKLELSSPAQLPQKNAKAGGGNRKKTQKNRSKKSKKMQKKSKQTKRRRPKRTIKRSKSKKN